MNTTPMTMPPCGQPPASFADEASAIGEINRLHVEAQRFSDESHRALDAALLAAWQAGKLLIAEKARIRRHAGRGAWLPWLKTCFRGGVRTAQRYMQLARRIETPSLLGGLSLRQSYLQLGIPIMSKGSGAERSHDPLRRLPLHVALVLKLTRLLRTQKRIGAKQAKKICPSPELDALYAQLRELYEANNASVQ